MHFTAGLEGGEHVKETANCIGNLYKDMIAVKRMQKRGKHMTKLKNSVAAPKAGIIWLK